METVMTKSDPKINSRWVIWVENVIFNVKWILVLFYLGLVVVMLLYAYAFVRSILLLAPQAPGFSTDQMKIVVLDFVDIVMVANLVKMIIAGSYNSFVSKAHGRPNENISSGTLKIKISTSIIVVCSIDLLRNLIIPNVDWDHMRIKLSIFSLFLVTTLVLGILEYLHIKGQAIEAGIQHLE
jgi:uncharacterized protein (TIGR00645 family)